MTTDIDTNFENLDFDAEYKTDIRDVGFCLFSTFCREFDPRSIVVGR